MSQRHQPEEWEWQGIDRLLDILAIIEAPGFRAYEWPEQQDRFEDGVRITPMPYPVYDQAVDQIWAIAYASSPDFDPYVPLTEDPTIEGVPIDIRQVRFCAEYFESATLNQVRRYLMLCPRRERFCDGYIAEQFDHGVLVAALRRLRQLRAMP